MRTSLNETKRIEDYLQGQMELPEQLLFEASMALDPTLAEKATWQKRVYGLIRLYGRKKLKMELEAIHLKLLSDPGHSTFKEPVLALFSNNRK